MEEALNRRTGIVTAAVTTAILALLGATAFARGNVGETDEPQEQETQYLPLLARNHDPTLGEPVFGVQMYGNTGESSPYHPWLIGSDATWLRVPISWRNTEPNDVDPPSYNWSSVDVSLSAAGANSATLSLIATVSDNPTWAATYRNGPIDQEDLGDFAEFLAALVERYDGDGIEDAPGSPLVRHWELYNEPDDLLGPGLEPHWGGYGDQYAQMLSIVYPAVKNADPRAQVLLGGLAYDWWEDQGGHFDRDFLDDVMLAGGGEYFDVMNFHIYPIFWYNWTDQESPGLLEKAEYLRDKMAFYGYPDRPMVITEAGWHSNYLEPPQPAGDEEIQARYVVELFTQNMAAEVQTMIWWMLYDPDPPYPYKNGLITNIQDDNPLQPKPSYLAFQVVVSELETAHFQGVLPPGQAGAPEMEAYEFSDNLQGRTVYVAWLDPIDTQAVEPLRVAASEATVRDIYGSSYPLSDGDDGQIDGFVTVDIGGQPVFIEVDW